MDAPDQDQPAQPPQDNMDHPLLADYNLTRPIHPPLGLRQGLPHYGDAHFALFLRKAFLKALGLGDDAVARPIVGITNTYSALNPCHAHVPQLIDAVKRGVQLAGGLALEFPTISLHESFTAPTSMLLRNLMAMDTEEMVRAQPVDACVVIGGCDKTLPAQLMGGLSSNKPIFPLVTGPMLPGSFRGARIGACTDCRAHWAAYRAGTLDVEDVAALNEELAPSGGTCGVMGTASTMACLVAAMGLVDLRAGATASAVSSARLRVAEETGRNAVHAALLTTSPSPTPIPTLATILTPSSFHNAITTLHALGGSTNAIIHLLALANRHPTLHNTITLQTIDDIGRHTPLLVNLKPSGTHYMADFHAAGGMLSLLHQLRPLLHLDAQTLLPGTPTLGALLDRHPTPYTDHTVIRPLTSPLYPSSPLVVLRGNLAPHGAILKPSATTLPLSPHRGPALVFSSPADLAARIDHPDLPVTASSVLILQNIGPKGGHYMPEAGLLPIPRKLARQGVTDMLRVSDGRMSGTAGGAVVLHVAPEAAEGGSVLGVVRDGDVVLCDVGRRVLEVEVDEGELARRMAERREKEAGEERVPPVPVRGYRALYERCVNGADVGADFDFLTATGT